MTPPAALRLQLARSLQCSCVPFRLFALTVPRMPCAETFNTAVSVFSIPDLPSREATAPADSCTAEEYLAGLSVMTAGVGPSIFIKAQVDSDVITTDL